MDKSRKLDLAEYKTYFAKCLHKTGSDGKAKFLLHSCSLLSFQFLSLYSYVAVEKNIPATLNGFRMNWHKHYGLVV